MSAPPQSLSDLAGRLTPDGVVSSAAAIDAGRTDAAEAAIVDHHGWVVAGLLTTPMQFQAGLVAREAGFFAFDRLERAFLPPAASWIHHDLGEHEFKITRVGDRVLSPKMWPFRQDAPVADFQLSSAPKWWSHGLVHALLGGGWWPGLDEWQLFHMARLSEALASWHWYWLSELGRKYCPRHDVTSGDGTPDCTVCHGFELDASRLNIRLERIRGGDGLTLAANSIEVLKYEAYCYQHGLETGQLVVPQGRYLAVGEAAEYARVHMRRLASDPTRRWREHCLVPDLDYATSPTAYEARAAGVAAAILRPTEPTRDVSAMRARRVLQDVGDRLCHAAALTDTPSAFQDGLTALADALATLTAGVSTADVDPLLGEALERAAADLQTHDGDLAQQVLQIGYRPTTSRDHEPEAMRSARRAGLLARATTARSPLRTFLPHVEPVLDEIIAHSRSANLLHDAAAGAEAAAVRDEGLLVLSGVLGWFGYAATQWGPDDAGRFMDSKWYYRLGARTLPPESEWGHWRLRPNPELDAITAGFDLAWTEDLLQGRLEPARVRRPRPAMRLAFVLVGQGRNHPLVLPFNDRRKGLLNRLQDTPTLRQLVDDMGFTPDDLTEAIDEELVICLHATDAARLYALNPLQHMASPGGDPQQIVGGELGGPWQKLEQAEYYAAYCERSSLYSDLASELVAAADVRPGHKVADVGCGTGVSAATALAAAGADGSLHGVDPALRMVIASRQAVVDERARFDQGTARLLPHLEVAFDRVICNSALWLDQDLTEALAAIHRCLAPEGRFAFSIPAEFLGHNEHWTETDAGKATARAIEEVRAELGLEQAAAAQEGQAAAAQPHPELLGSIDRVTTALEAAGFAAVTATLYRRPWTVGDYIDWLSQPVVLHAAVDSDDEARQTAFVEALKRRVDLAAPFESRWYLVTADVSGP